MTTPRPHRSRLHRVAVVLAVSTLAVAGAGSMGAPVVRASTSCASGVTHEVVDGDTWFDIARGAAVSMRSVLDANDADEDTVLHPGDTVCMPAGAAATSSCRPANAPTYTVERGDTWWEIAQRAGISLRDLLDRNGATERTALHPGRAVCLPMGSSLAAADGGASTTTAAAARGPAASTASAGLDALPMQGPCWFSDDFGDPRGGGRRHQGNDLFAEFGSYVYAVVDGTLTRRAWDQPGSRSGHAWWLTAGDGSGTYYFYAHLDDFAPGLEVGSRVEAGEIIGFMGNTGNSAYPHLHFEIHPGGGAAVNPYPLLRSTGGCKTGAGYEQPNGWIPD
jgi:murein DD-endopeptidase MepM/ murein hydrolase activator NlpD